MRVQIITFNLAGIGPEEYAALCDQLAPTWAELPGLVAKTWLANPATNTYGGVYLWRDQAALDAYLASDLLRGVMANPNLANLTSADFAIMEAPSAVTRGLAMAATA
jgi:hypothetical protein